MGMGWVEVGVGGSVREGQHSWAGLKTHSEKLECKWETQIDNQDKRTQKNPQKITGKVDRVEKENMDVQRVDGNK